MFFDKKSRKDGFSVLLGHFFEKSVVILLSPLYILCFDALSHGVVCVMSWRFFLIADDILGPAVSRLGRLKPPTGPDRFAY